MSEDIHLLIEEYLDGLLGAEEVAAFERRLKTDKNLSAAFALRKDMTQFLKNKEAGEVLKNQLEKIGDDFFTENESIELVPAPIKEPLPHRPSTPEAKPTKTVFLPFRKLAAAAAVILLLGMVYWFYPTPDLYRQFAQHEKLQLNEKGVSDNQLRTKIQTAFNNSDYTSTLLFIDEYLLTNADDLQAQLAKGIALLETDRTTEAKLIFEQIASGETLYRWEASWYLALSYLKEENNAKVREILTTIPATEIQWHKKASALLAEME